jgi:hypothetical protein
MSKKGEDPKLGDASASPSSSTTSLYHSPMLPFYVILPNNNHDGVGDTNKSL